MEFFQSRNIIFSLINGYDNLTQLFTYSFVQENIVPNFFSDPDFGFSIATTKNLFVHLKLFAVVRLLLIRKTWIIRYDKQKKKMKRKQNDKIITLSIEKYSNIIKVTVITSHFYCCCSRFFLSFLFFIRCFTLSNDDNDYDGTDGRNSKNDFFSRFFSAFFHKNKKQSSKWRFHSKLVLDTWSTCANLELYILFHCRNSFFWARNKEKFLTSSSL